MQLKPSEVRPCSDHPLAPAVMELVRSIPVGCVTCYRDIAHGVGCKSYRLIGRILGGNTDIPNTPCHRVIHADGRIGGYAKGTGTKCALLAAEGVEISHGRVKQLNLVHFPLPNRLCEKI